jgi:hypothetical protein
VKKREIPAGAHKWLTVVSAEAPDEVELSLEPNANPAGKTFQQAMFDQGIPITAFEVSDIAAAMRGSRRVASRNRCAEPNSKHGVATAETRAARSRPIASDRANR